MASYRLLITASAAKELESVGATKHRRRIVARIRSLGLDPRPGGCQKLGSVDRYRMCQGPYRILYEIDDSDLVVTIVKIGHRKDVYR